MKLTVQRVTETTVLVAGEVVFRIGRGILCFVGIHKNNKDGDADWIAQRLLSMFYLEADYSTHWKKGIPEIQGEVVLPFQPGLMCEFSSQKPEETSESYSAWSETLIRLRKSEWQITEMSRN
jgi:D-Tyr-tRNAtyr deacylase